MSDERNLPIFLTTEELADMLRKSPRTIEDWRLDGKGPDYIKLGLGQTARIIYPMKNVETWLATLHKQQKNNRSKRPKNTAFSTYNIPTTIHHRITRYRAGFAGFL